MFKELLLLRSSTNVKASLMVYQTRQFPEHIRQKH